MKDYFLYRQLRPSHMILVVYLCRRYGADTKQMLLALWDISQCQPYPLVAKFRYIRERSFVLLHAHVVPITPPTPNGSKGLAIATAVQDLASRVLEDILLAAIGRRNSGEEPSA